jgi:peptide/nickel transport system substrate-binding protein
MKQVRLLTILATFALLLNACGTHNGDKTANRIVYGLTLEPSGFDPHINRSSELGIVLRQVYDTLLYRDPTTSEFVPGLATRWEVSPDGLSYTFSLRQGVTFQDGTPFDAPAVGDNLDRITSPDTASQNAVYMLGPYTGYDVIDRSTIRIRLSQPYPPLLDALCQVYLAMASPTAFKQYSTTRYQFHQVGTGPFSFVEYIPGDHITLRRNPNYTWGPAFYQAPSSSSVDEIEFRFYTDPPTRSLALENGQAQIMGELSPTDARSLTGNSRIRLFPTDIPGQPLQFLMNTKHPPTDNPVVRQALLFAANRDVIVNTVFQGFSPVAWGPLAANTLYYSKDVRGAYAQDTGQARSLLSSLGYQDANKDGILERSGADLEITMLVPNWGFVPQVAELLQQQWREIGVKLLLDPVPTLPALTEKVKSGNYNLVEFDTWGLDPTFLKRYFTSNGDTNWTGFSSSELDGILTNAERQSDPNMRRNLYAQAQRIIMDNALILPIRDYVNLNASSASVDGLVFDPYGWFPLLNNVTITQ